MGRHAKDPSLYALANKLKQLDTFTQYPALKDEAESLWQTGELRNVYLMKDAKTFAIKLWLGNACRIIGYSLKLVDACRFADMARWHFAKYRVRDRREPTDSDLNFPVAQVKNDLENEPKAIALLQEITSYLIGIDALNAATPSLPISRRERRHTVRDEFNTRFVEVESQFDALAQMIQTVIAGQSRIEAELALFKRDRIPAARIDIEAAKPVTSESAKDMKEPLKPVIDRAEFERVHGLPLTPIGVNPAPEQKSDELLGDIFTIDQPSTPTNQPSQP